MYMHKIFCKSKTESPTSFFYPNPILAMSEKGKEIPEELVKVISEAVAKSIQASLTSISNAISQAVTASIQQTAEALRGPPPSEWEIAEAPMKTEISEKERELEQFIIKVSREARRKELVPFKTHTLLDYLFYKPDGSLLGGIPCGAQFAIVGLPGAGKSILMEEIALRVANDGKKVLFITSEDTWASATERYDLQSRMIEKAEKLGIDWAKVSENLFVMDTVSCSELREWKTFAESYRYAVESYNIDLAIIDSVTVLEEYRGALKYRVMELCRYNQLKGVTALYVNQRREESWDSYSMAGGLGLAHNLDGTIIVDFGRVYWLDQQIELGMRRGEFARIVRVLECRLCDYERRRIPIEITRSGFVRPTVKLPLPREPEKPVVEVAGS